MDFRDGENAKKAAPDDEDAARCFCADEEFHLPMLRGRICKTVAAAQNRFSKEERISKVIFSDARNPLKKHARALPDNKKEFCVSFAEPQWVSTLKRIHRIPLFYNEESIKRPLKKPKQMMKKF